MKLITLHGYFFQLFSPFAIVLQYYCCTVHSVIILFFFLYYSKWGEAESTSYCGRYWPIVPALDDR
jgi:hypothetical protein